MTRQCGLKPLLVLLISAVIVAPPLAAGSAQDSRIVGKWVGKLKPQTFKGHNHLFQRCTTGSPLEYAEIEETMSPEVLDSMTTWILETTGSRKGRLRVP